MPLFRRSELYSGSVTLETARRSRLCCSWRTHADHTRHTRGRGRHRRDDERLPQAAQARGGAPQRAARSRGARLRRGSGAKAAICRTRCGGTTPATRAQEAGYAYCQIAENLAMASDSRGFSAQDYADRARARLAALARSSPQPAAAASDRHRRRRHARRTRRSALHRGAAFRAPAIAALRIQGPQRRQAAGRLRVRRQALRPRARAIQGAHGVPAARHQRVRRSQAQGLGTL